ncbi:hypothetical protein Ancab_021759 [Ancistrocladus abbreviatus]
MGGNMVLISVLDQSKIQTLVNNPSYWLHQLFTDISLWSCNSTSSERFVWMRCLGLPLPSGMLNLLINKDTLERRRFDVARFLISTPIFHLLSSPITIYANNHQYIIHIYEELNRVPIQSSVGQSVGSETPSKVSESYLQHDAASLPWPAIPFTDLPSNEFETLSTGSIRPSADTYASYNNAVIDACPNHDDKGSDGIKCHLDGPGGIVEKTLSLPSRRLKSIKPKGRPNSVSQPLLATAYKKNKFGTFSLSSIEYHSQPITPSKRNARARPHHIPKYSPHLLGRPSQILIRGLRLLKRRAKKLLPSAHPLPINHSIISSPSSPQQPTVSGNSLSNSHIQNMNRLFLLNHCSLDAEAIWDVGKVLGVEFPSHDHEILDRFKTIEDKDREAWEKVQRG